MTTPDSIAVTGSHGLIGSALVQQLRAAGHRVVTIERPSAGAAALGPDAVAWDPDAGTFDASALGPIDAVVHLAGVGIAEHRWTTAHKARILDSRVAGTRLLASALSRLDRPPSTLLSASAIGYYGDRGDETLTEASATGNGFLADVCRQWEGATSGATDAGIRVVHLRTGVVLSGRGGALRRQLPLFKLGLGGRLGNGRQYTSWIALADQLDAIEFCLGAPQITGPANLTAPHPVTNAELTAAIGRAVHRPALLRVPRTALRLVMGTQLTAELLFASQRVLPSVLASAGYSFRLPDLDDALRAALD
ncbi:MAG: TIGR01777 family oxidoreductase [Acidimicrobiales bacterium]